MSGDRATGLLLTFARRGEDDAAMQAIVRLRADGAAGIVAVGTPVSAPILQGLGVDDIILYAEGASARRVIAELRRRRPRVAAVVYWDSTHAGHLKLEALAFLSGAARVVRLSPEGDVETIGRAALGWSVFSKCGRAFGCVAAGVVICGIAFIRLRTAQMLAGGSGASRH